MLKILSRNDPYTVRLIAAGAALGLFVLFLYTGA